MELDLHDIGVDIRDYYRPMGGPSRLTLRRLLLLVDGMRDKPSRFWAAVRDDEPLGIQERLIADVFHAVSGNPHPLTTRREDERKRREREAKKARILAAKRRQKQLRRAMAAQS